MENFYKELRAGNFISIGHSKAPKAVTPRLISIIENDPKGFNPIPLTEEWLFRFGFHNKSQTTDYYFNLGSFIIGGTGKRLFPSIHGESGLEAFGNETKYVHQLQNLYNALTGEELTLKDA